MVAGDELLAALREAAELHRLTITVQRLQVRINEAERMYTLGVLVAGIGHELRNPLGWVTTNLGFSRRAISNLEARLGSRDPQVTQALSALPKEQLQLTSRSEIFETFRALHPQLKERFYLNSKEHDSDPYESSQISILIANAHGVFGVESYREVFEFERFWAIGSGRRYALGAMYATWNRAKSAREVADAGVRAGCEFDTSSAAPVRLHALKLKP